MFDFTRLYTQPVHHRHAIFARSADDHDDRARPALGVRSRSVPWSVVSRSGQSWSVFGAVLCRVYYALTCVNMFTGTFTVMLMSIDRFVAVWWPVVCNRSASFYFVQRYVTGIARLSTPRMSPRRNREFHNSTHSTFICQY